MEFVWGGCGGNRNRFSSMNECEERCATEQDREEEKKEGREQIETIDEPLITSPAMGHSRREFQIFMFIIKINCSS